MRRKHTLAEEDAVFDDTPIIGDPHVPRTSKGEPTTVKVVLHDVGIKGDGLPTYAPPEPSRTPMQRTQDEILDKAVVAVVTAQEAADEALAWMEVIITLPKELRHNLPALLTDLGTLISEERRLRQ